jgi:geranylgeranyl pyrophosphate synthase
MTTLAPGGAPPELAAYIDEARAWIDRELDERLRVRGDDPGRLAEAIHYAATGPGKRLRPAIVLAACEACGGTRAHALPCALAIEMLHAYTLVHDDLPAMDDDDERRGRPTAHKRFGEAIAILAGDGLLTAAFGALAELGAHAADAVAVLARRAGARELLLGQALDLTAPPRDGVQLERMHAAKTGALFAASAELGGIAAGASPTTRAALARFGLALGIAFQHADDRDDGEHVQRADVSAARMRELCADARAAIEPLGTRGSQLAAFASWIAAKA